MNIKPSRVPVILVGIAVALSLLGDQALYSILPIYFKQLGLFPFQVGILLSANRWIRLITNHLAEFLILKYRLPGLLSLVLLLAALLTLSYGALPLFIVLLIARLLWGFCWSMFRQIGIMVALDAANTENHGRSVGFFNGIYRTGSMAGSFLGALLFDLVGYTVTFISFGLVCLLGVPLTWFNRTKLPAIKATRVEVDEPFALCQHKQILFYGFVIGLVGTGLIFSTLGFILQHQLGNSITINGLVIGITTITGFMLASQHATNTVGAPFLGSLADWIGHRRSALLFSATAALIMFTATFANSPLLLVGLVLAFFIAETAVRVVVEVKAGQSGPKPYSFYATAFDLGAALGPVIGWALFEMVNSPRLVFILGGSLYALTAIFFWKSLQKQESQ